MKASITLGKIAGIEIGLHYSWFAILALVTWSLATGFLPDRYPGWAPGTYWATGLVAPLLLFGSVLLHELAHSLVAQARGIPVHGITLFLLGGVSNLQADARRPRDEFAIAIVGPLASLGIAAVLWTVLLVSTDTRTPVMAVVWYLAFLNFILAVFNLLPAFPLDGGRVLRSIVWAITGNLSKATSIAALGGQAVGFILMGVGVLDILYGGFSGVLYVILGWFLLSAATISKRETVANAGYEGVRVRDVMETAPVTIGPDIPLSEAVFDYFLRHGTGAMPVCSGDTLLGIITLSDVKGVPRDVWSGVSVRDEMTPLPLWHVGPEDVLLRAMTLLGEHSINQVPVMSGDRLVGLLRRAHIIRFMHSRGEMGRGLD